jgi:hypothetical protein
LRLILKGFIYDLIVMLDENIKIREVYYTLIKKEYNKPKEYIDSPYTDYLRVSEYLNLIFNVYFLFEYNDIELFFYRNDLNLNDTEINYPCENMHEVSIDHVLFYVLDFIMDNKRRIILLKHYFTLYNEYEHFYLPGIKDICKGISKSSEYINFLYKNISQDINYKFKNEDIQVINKTWDFMMQNKIFY